MPRFKDYNYKQNKMLVLNFEDQLQSGTFEHAIHYLIDNKLDLSIFHHHYKNNTTGQKAYAPAILLKIVLFAYSKGITSSREIEWCCHHNIIFKALSCDSEPHFTTIAAFVSQHQKEITALFEQVLLVCYQQGLLGNELFAIDGCKMSSNASKEWSGTFKELQHKRDKLKNQIRFYLNQHREMDKLESRDEAREKRTQHTIDTLSKAADKIDTFLKKSQPRMGRGKIKKEVKSNITDNESAKMLTNKGTIQGYNGVATVDKKHQVIVDAQAFGEGQEHHTLQPVLETVKERMNRLNIRKNIYKSRIIVTADTCFCNEANVHYLKQNKINAYIPDNQFRSRDPKFIEQKTKHGKRHQNKIIDNGFKVIASSEFKFNTSKKECICPAGERLSFRREDQDPYGNTKQYYEGRLLQCRHCKLRHRCMKNPKASEHRKGAGRQVSVIVKKGSKPKAIDWMKQRVDSERGKEIYSHRMSVVEPVFGNIGTNKGLSRFSLRGKQKVDGQWKLYCMVHNIEKLMKYGQLAH